jgi:hypothetical protein
METLQWIIAAITAGFVASVGYLQWRTAQTRPSSTCLTSGTKCMKVFAKPSHK